MKRPRLLRGLLAARLSVVALITGILPVSFAQSALAETIVYPSDAGVLDVTKFGANGNDTQDDTAAFKAAVAEMHNRKQAGLGIYIPNGTYYLSDTVSVVACTYPSGRNSMIGQSQNAVILKLRPVDGRYDNTSNPRAVISYQPCNYPPSPKDGSNANFQNYAKNFTIDTGSHAGAIGIAWQSHNGGVLRDVTVKGTGVYGVDMRQRWPGPSLVERVTVEGFDYGIYAASQEYSSVFENITVRNQTRAGFGHLGHPLSMRRLKSENAVPAIAILNGDSWNGYSFPGHNASLTLLDSELKGSNGGISAIEVGTSDTFVRLKNVSSSGYKGLISSNPSLGASVGEVVSQGFSSLFESPTQGMNLPIKDAPIAPEYPLSEWVSVKSFSNRVSNGDWAPAIQAAIDSGKKVVYFPFGRYEVKSPIYIRGAVEIVDGIGSYILADAAFAGPVFHLQNGSSPTVWLRNFLMKPETWNPKQFEKEGGVVDNSQRTVVLQEAIVEGYKSGSQAGNLFMNDSGGGTYLTLNYPQNVWIRQLNIEDTGRTRPKIINNAANLWILGYKTEGAMTALQSNSGKTEILGGMIYVNASNSTPMVEINGGQVCANNTLFYANSTLVKETRNGQTKTMANGANNGTRHFNFCSHQSSASSTPAPSTTPSAFEVREAEIFDDQQGVAVLQSYNEGAYVGRQNPGDWVAYTIDFGNGFSGAEARLATPHNGVELTVHLDKPDGPIIAVFKPTSTGWWDWRTVRGVIGTKVTGVHKVYFKADGLNAEILDTNWFRFLE
jgi:Carbohydrate binding module (family 6)/Pectate lyase superfamily protein